MKYNYKAVVMGTSSGGLDALTKIIPELPDTFPLPIMVVQHMHKTSDTYLANYLNKRSALTVKEADDKEPIRGGYVYIAPPNYHLLVENEKSLSLSIDAPVNFSRPSIDVLFESASDVYQSNIIGIILTGANNDGTEGLKKIKQHKGLAIVQDPEEAESDFMPRSALNFCKVDHVLSLGKIALFLKRISKTVK